MDEAAEAIRARARLWLRSERVLGLDGVPWRGKSISSTPADSEHALHSFNPQLEIDRTPSRATASSSPRVASTIATTTAGTASSTATSSALFSADLDILDASPLPREQKHRILAILNETKVSTCTLCRLCETRKNTVFGEGDLDAQIFFIGEGPGENEDLQGRPFVGRAGEKLNEMIAAMGLRREQVYIANIVKCRPPGNRAPAPDETEACTPYLVEQIATIRPKVIVTLGLPAAKFMLNSNLSMTRLRGQWHAWRGIRLMPTFHPAYILRNYTVETRKAVWSDLQKVMQELGLKPTKERQNAVAAVHTQ